MACSAAVLASERPFHQPINKKDIIPTPSHPIKSWYILFDKIIVSIAIRNANRYLRNLLIFGSVDIYQVENSVIDHVMNRAIGINIRDSVSSVIEMLMFSVVVAISDGDDRVSLELLFSSKLIGIRLIINSNIRLFLILLIGVGLSVIEINREIKIVNVIVGIIRLISTTWICTKDFGA